MSAGAVPVGAALLAVSEQELLFSIYDENTGWYDNYEVSVPAGEFSWSTTGLDLTAGGVTITGSARQVNVTAATPVGSLTLQLTPQGPPLYYSGTGVTQLLSDKNYEYAFPEATTTGTLTAEGSTYPVSDTSWFDRQWGPEPLLDPTMQWTWMGLTLSNGDEVAIWDILDLAGQNVVLAENLIHAAHAPCDTHEVPRRVGRVVVCQGLRGSGTRPVGCQKCACSVCPAARSSAADEPSGTGISLSVNQSRVACAVPKSPIAAPRDWHCSASPPSTPRRSATSLDRGAGGQAPARGHSADEVTAGPTDYPQVAARDPDQWFNEWNYPDGCPPVPGLTAVSAAPRSGSVTLSWPDAGLGLAYLVYLRTPGTTGYVLKKTVPWVLTDPAHPIVVTLSGLPAGRYQAKVVPLNLKILQGHAAQVAFQISRPGL
jgi:hypothetical protein